MSRHRSLRIRFEESGINAANPLLGRVFDSDHDVPDEEFSDLVRLVEHCGLTRSGELPGKRPNDFPTFGLSVEADDGTIEVVGDSLRADEKMRELLSFIRKRSRKEMLK